MIDLDAAVARVLMAYPDKDEDVVRSTLRRMISEVRNASVERGDFTYQSTARLHVQKVWYDDMDEPDEVEVFVRIAGDYDTGELV